MVFSVICTPGPWFFLSAVPLSSSSTLSLSLLFLSSLSYCYLFWPISYLLKPLHPLFLSLSLSLSLFPSPSGLANTFFIQLLICPSSFSHPVFLLSLFPSLSFSVFLQVLLWLFLPSLSSCSSFSCGRELFSPLPSSRSPASKTDCFCRSNSWSPTALRKNFWANFCGLPACFFWRFGVQGVVLKKASSLLWV